MKAATFAWIMVQCTNAVVGVLVELGGGTIGQPSDNHYLNWDEMVDGVSNIEEPFEPEGEDDDGDRGE